MVYNLRIGPVNNFGGNMPQARLDQIKSTWMDRNGKTEQEWIEFQPQTKLALDAIVAQRDPAEDWNFDSPDEEATKMEFIFCPDWREMGFRYRAKSRVYGSLAKQALEAGNPVLASNCIKEMALWSRFSIECFTREADIRRKL